MIVACVWVQANVPFTSEYVFKLRQMVRRHLDRTHRFICLTDQPGVLQDVETIRVPTPHGWPGWWSKLELFNPAHWWALGREQVLLYLDLDVLVLSDLWPLVAYGMDSTLTLVPDEGVFQGSNGKRVVKRYNSSVMTFATGSHADLYTEWNSDVTRELWGDQDWIGERLPNQLTFPRAWFPRISNIGAVKEKAAGARVVLCKRPKNHIAAQMWPWVKEAWQ